MRADDQHDSCECTCIYIYIHMYMRVGMYIHIHTYAHANAHVYVFVFVHMRMHMYLYLYFSGGNSLRVALKHSLSCPMVSSHGQLFYFGFTFFMLIACGKVHIHSGVLHLARMDASTFKFGLWNVRNWSLVIIIRYHCKCYDCGFRLTTISMFLGTL